MKPRLVAIFATSLACPCLSAEWALINLIRHGERDNNASNPHLAKAGYERAAYIARCVATSHHTLAFPFGPPSRLLASLRSPKAKGEKQSVRPLETLAPLAAKLGIEVDNHVDMGDVDSFVRYVQRMETGETLFVAWQHWFLTFLVEALGFEGLVPTTFPRSCNYTQWSEPAYAMDPDEGDCYDVIWQLVLFRESPSDSWRTDGFAQLHQGFGGSRNSPCVSAFHPDSTPTYWGRAQRSAAGPSSAEGSALEAAASQAATVHSAEDAHPSIPHHSLLVGSGFILGAAIVTSLMARRRKGVTEPHAVGVRGETRAELSTDYEYRSMA